MVVDMRLGLDNKRKAMHKAAGAVTWTYAEGCVAHTNDGVGFTLSAVDTLALANLLYAHYEEIVREARIEQRKTEASLDPKRRGYYYPVEYERKPKPPKDMV